MNNDNGARGGLRHVALLYSPPFTQINRLNHILLGHLKNISEKFIVHLLDSIFILLMLSAPK